MSTVTLHGLPADLPSDVHFVLDELRSRLAAFGHDLELSEAPAPAQVSAASTAPEPYGPPAHDRFAFHGTEPAPPAPESAAPTPA